MSWYTPQAGLHILYFLDYAVSCGWWLMIVQLVQVSKLENGHSLLLAGGRSHIF